MAHLLGDCPAVRLQQVRNQLIGTRLAYTVALDTGGYTETRLRPRAIIQGGDAPADPRQLTLTRAVAVCEVIYGRCSDRLFIFAAIARVRYYCN